MGLYEKEKGGTEGDAGSATGVKRQTYDFVLVSVRERSPGDLFGAIQHVVEIVCAHGGLQSVFGTDVLALFDASRVPNSSDNRIAAVTQLTRELGPELAVLHGERECLVGPVTSDWSIRFVHILPDREALLQKLWAMQYGEAMEV